MSLPVRSPQRELSGWEGFSGLSQLRSQLDALLSGWDEVLSRAGAFTPLADLEETDEAYVAEIELPGVNLEDLSVEVAGRRLTVTGERKERERVGILRRRTRTVGRFHYEVLLPGEVDEEGVTAALHDGVLTVKVPKPASERPRRIRVVQGSGA
ncbi:MAG TPA: Hsp20/alpha crystallin family protein [Acidimicrobiales bacterium]|nr:Hsp20/alpha crystallin family protein [Acidimicrobiales bacterium]